MRGGKKLKLLCFLCAGHSTVYSGHIDTKGWMKSCGNTPVESCQLCRHEQGLLDELVQPVETVVCQSNAVCRT